MRIPAAADMALAAERLAGRVHRTPVITSRWLDSAVGARLFCKCENLQQTGAFKFRGALNAVLALDPAVAARGVVTHSSGNHGQALARAAALRGIPCHVVMPATASRAKRAAVLGYGGRITECGPSQSARESACARIRAETGAETIHPYNDPQVIAGQATCARELLEQVPELDAILAPIGGGGLISGTCLAVAGRTPGVAVFAAEPAAADDAARSLAAGRLLADDAPDTVADGLRASLLPLTWHFVSGQVAGILTVSEAAIIAAMRLVWERMKLVVEASAAVPVAVALQHRDRFAGQRVGVILSGGNVDLDRLPWRPEGGA